ncbi:hypothetical protein GLOIN_2v138034 [Rhizophagus irregularis DAOM 181602=DAOM 197198]|nr:hypothetical protein GLOIN_2v138034 [Rhizophagus irregularis DAOM 181602=DAOM 197198]
MLNRIRDRQSGAIVRNQKHNDVIVNHTGKSGGLTILRSPSIKPSICLSGRSPCEKQDIKHVGFCIHASEKFSQWTMNLGNDLEAKIKTDRPDLEEINIELYRKDFFQENNVLINTVNSDKPEKRQGVELTSRRTYPCHRKIATSQLGRGVVVESIPLRPTADI